MWAHEGGEWGVEKAPQRGTSQFIVRVIKSTRLRWQGMYPVWRKVGVLSKF